MRGYQVIIIFFRTVQKACALLTTNALMGHQQKTSTKYCIFTPPPCPPMRTFAKPPPPSPCGRPVHMVTLQQYL